MKKTQYYLSACHPYVVKPKNISLKRTLVVFKDAPYEIFQKKSKDDEALAYSRMLLCLSPASNARFYPI
jgi:hypothetical protein